ARGDERRDRRRFERLSLIDALLCSLGVFRLALDADETAAEMLGDGAGGAGAAERIEHEIVDTRTRQDHAREQRLRLLRRMQLLAVAAFETFFAGAQGDRPVGTHLDVLVAGFE